MKGVYPFVLVLMILVVAILGYYNMKQKRTIELLNEEIFEQARLRHNLVFEKHLLEQKLQVCIADSSRIN
ncbi:MAG: hypothetical protein ACI85Q_002294 [Salibacteraceae bacterium]|jgi:hypothetical protein